MKNFKKALAVILAVIMSFTVLLPAASAAGDTKKIPHIDFRGFMSYTVYKDKDDENSEKAFPMSTNSIVEAVAALVPALGGLALTDDWDTFGDIFIPALNKLLAPVAFDKNGEAQNNTGVHFTYPTKEELEKANLYTDFIYDWRDDPFKSAAELNDFVNYLVDDLGYESVALECHSYAGIVMLTYLTKYGTSKIHSCCFNATAVYGAEFAGELVKGNVSFSDEALVEFLKGLFDHNDYELILGILVDALKTAGITGFLSDFINNLFTKLSDRIWSESILPIFGNWPSIWAMVPDSELEAGLANVFGDVTIASSGEFSGLFEKINSYNELIRDRREENLKAINDTTNLYVIARYGYSGVPLGDIWTANTDSVLNTSAESFGAICKDYTFSSDEISGEYISPNGAIDASTCLFPEQTWFIRDCKHTQREEKIINFAHTLLMSDSQATIKTYSEYPQFLLFDADTEDVIIDDNKPTEKNTFFNKIAELFQKIINFIKSILNFKK